MFFSLCFLSLFRIGTSQSIKYSNANNYTNTALHSSGFNSHICNRHANENERLLFILFHFPTTNINNEGETN